MTDDVGVGRLRIQGDWDLEMISDISHVYVQVYSAGCFLLGPRYVGLPSPAHSHSESETGRYSYPWRGGFSAVNFFRSIHAQLPVRYRPEVLELSYASPGFIELVGYSAAISLVVRTVTKNAERILDLYKNIQEEIRKKELNKLEMRERHAHSSFIESAYRQLVDAIELPGDATERLHEVTEGDRWARLKIALALSRRIEKIAEFERANVLSLDEPRSAAAMLHGGLSEEKTRKIQAKLDSALPQHEQVSIELNAKRAEYDGDDNE